MDELMNKLVDNDPRLTFDDVSTVPAASDFPPSKAILRTHLVGDIYLNIPIISAAMDRVTEHQMAIAMARRGGLGVIHKNMSVEAQAREVVLTKRADSVFVLEPITIEPSAQLHHAVVLMRERKVSGLMVVHSSGEFVGVLTKRDILLQDLTQMVSARMSTSLTVGPPGISFEEARALMLESRVERLPIVKKNKLVGLATLRNILEQGDPKTKTVDDQGNLRVAAAIGSGTAGLERAEALLAGGCDVLVVDSAHGHAQAVVDTVRDLKASFPKARVIAGNITTESATEALILSGAGAVKIGQGPGSICTTRIVAGTGIPQISAIMDCAKAARDCRHIAHLDDFVRFPVIADGGIRTSGDVVKALVAGADCVMLGMLLAATDEAPGQLIREGDRTYKAYRGMGSLSAMKEGSKARYFQEEVASDKLVAEGVEGKLPYKGPVGKVLDQIVGGLKAGMGYVGCKTIPELHERAQLIRVTNAGLTESHPHDIYF